MSGTASFHATPEAAPRRSAARKRPLHLTRRDEHADTLEDLFDFDRSPSLRTAVGQAPPPAADCTPH